MGTVWGDFAAFAGSLDAWRHMCPGSGVVLASGGFDPLHVGHVRYLRAAARLGRRLVVLVNGDGFLLRKKGYAFMPLAERLELVAALEGVRDAVAWDSDGQFVADAIARLRPDVFAKGGDRSTPEAVAACERDACREARCRLVLGVGGSTKVQSSGRLVEPSRRAGGV